MDRVSALLGPVLKSLRWFGILTRHAAHRSVDGVPFLGQCLGRVKAKAGTRAGDENVFWVAHL
jgi:hypothetical protein